MTHKSRSKTARKTTHDTSTPLANVDVRTGMTAAMVYPCEDSALIATIEATQGRAGGAVRLAHARHA